MNIEFECKPFTSINEQLDLLESRGLIIDDKVVAADILANISYYRFSAYSLTLRKNDKFYQNVHFDNVLTLYNFDAALRQIIFKYSLLIEVAFRSRIAHFHSEKYGPLGYRHEDTFEDARDYNKNISKIDKSIRVSRNQSIEHYRDKLLPKLGYDYPAGIPLWVAIEEISFDTLSKLYANMKTDDRRLIAESYCNLTADYVKNRLHCVVIARNISAHGGRFYNRPMTIGVKLPKYLLSVIAPQKTFAYIFAIYSLLPTDTGRTAFISELRGLFKDYPFAKPEHLGFPSRWVDVLEVGLSKSTFIAVFDKSKNLTE